MDQEVSRTDFTPEPQQNEAQTGHSNSGSLIQLFAVLAFIYVLGVGPAFRILPFPAAGFLYWPPIKLAQVYPAFGHLLAWYMIDCWKNTIQLTV